MPTLSRSQRSSRFADPVSLGALGGVHLLLARAPPELPHRNLGRRLRKPPPQVLQVSVPAATLTKLLTGSASRVTGCVSTRG
eukprot:392062-Rhodomonas_salina.1